MSRVAKNPIQIPEKTDVTISENEFKIKGHLGEIIVPIPSGFKVIQDNNLLNVDLKNEILRNNPVWGTLRSLVANAVKGVSEGFEKTLELTGTGFRASLSGKILKLQLGYSHDVNYNIPDGVKIECSKQNLIKISSHDKELLGRVAAEIRSYRKPEPFKGKGIKYLNEYIFRKEGKKK
ncbi:MAG: 50S ribosomal protein L6 [Alphaproteobacteria bacterium MarineAlpha5_Bin11]|nr:50S ribosomal protein L6 [Pelagibacteraceae bacterium]PPR43501.1 MAG: 50S ribosomal protein L6 [Alphaproteobacteria bacterium MarineAlpha5_Bin11]PPR51755.1 MAG: 50S ribosomal protein L6 [Alphaproteobacteria bacterium MarineAlpha5_Bin10]|tara:strand:- start:21928 stop:22461 length:534 start_codon:yes stop_codon:yes gene_type:complete